MTVWNHLQTHLQYLKPITFKNFYIGKLCFIVKRDFNEEYLNREHLYLESRFNAKMFAELQGKGRVTGPFATPTP